MTLDDYNVGISAIYRELAEISKRTQDMAKVGTAKTGNASFDNIMVRQDWLIREATRLTNSLLPQQRSDDPNALANELAARLMKLHRDLEDRGDRGMDWSLARSLEDRIGAYQPVAGDFDSAEALLKKHGY
ncbi:hypothetical protein [Trinickia sp. EG282A]|uniref:hypothetical protein n=1 Tax=Trinickia sp. EG282A TaxID=3237013 RepID=UPI0034D36C13